MVCHRYFCSLAHYCYEVTSAATFALRSQGADWARGLSEDDVEKFATYEDVYLNRSPIRQCPTSYVAIHRSQAHTQDVPGSGPVVRYGI